MRRLLRARLIAALSLSAVTAAVLPTSTAAVAETATDPLPGFDTEPAAGIVDTELLAAMEERGPDASAGGLVHFVETIDYATATTQLTDLGLTVGVDLPAINVAYAYGPAPALVDASYLSSVTRIETPLALPLEDDTAGWATRTRTTTGTAGIDLGIADGQGIPVDGSGVGIAVVDSGIDATHPDLLWKGLDPENYKTALNFKVACPGDLVGVGDTTVGFCFNDTEVDDVANSDTTSGHGTHVAGGAAGTGELSNGYIRGAAPGATLYGFGSGEGASILIVNALWSFQWVYDNGLQQDPPIRIVTNSWGGSGDYDPTDAVSKLARALIEDRGISVLFAAGNSNAEGSTDYVTPPNTSSYGRTDLGGLIMVANYDDQGTGTRDGALSASSSVGVSGSPLTWPDLAAPGSSILSTCAPNTVLCTVGASEAYSGRYAYMSGTSMATPRVAGIAALLYQADPTLTPAEVETILEDTAYQFDFGEPYAPDPANPGSLSSPDKGHGLVDAEAALRALLDLDDPTDGFGGVPSVDVTITSPADGATVESDVTVTGGSDVTVDRPAQITTIASGDAGDNLFGANDIDEVRFIENGDGTVTVEWQVVDAEDVGLYYPIFRYNVVIDGTSHVFEIVDSATGPSNGDSGTDTPTSVEQVGNVFRATYDAAGLGIHRGSLLYDAYAFSYRSPGLPSDVAPGGADGTYLTEPQRGPGVTAVYDVAAPHPVPTISVSVDGDEVGTAEPAGDGSWSYDVTGLAPGVSHEIGAVGTVQGVSSEATTTVQVPVPLDVTIDVPTDGTEVGAGNTLITGTADLPEGATLTVTATGGGLDGAPLDVAITGQDGITSTWAAGLDLTDASGTVTITATGALDGREVVDTAELTVVRPGVSVADVAVNETDGEVAVTLELDRAALSDVLVRVATADRTAQAGKDYTAFDDVVSFAAGERTATITIAIEDDNRREGDETFEVLLSDIVGGTAGDTIAYVTILDDDLHRPQRGAGFGSG